MMVVRHMTREQWLIEQERHRRAAEEQAASQDIPDVRPEGVEKVRDPFAIKPTRHTRAALAKRLKHK